MSWILSVDLLKLLVAATTLWKQCIPQLVAGRLRESLWFLCSVLERGCVCSSEVELSLCGCCELDPTGSGLYAVAVARGVAGSQTKKFSQNVEKYQYFLSSVKMMKGSFILTPWRTSVISKRRQIFLFKSNLFIETSLQTHPYPTRTTERLTDQNASCSGRSHNETLWKKHRKEFVYFYVHVHLSCSQTCRSKFTYPHHACPHTH